MYAPLPTRAHIFRPQDMNSIEAFGKHLGKLRSRTFGYRFSAIPQIVLSLLRKLCNLLNELVTHSRMDIHTTGYAWRYVRASMSLAGLVPPMTDEGDMLCDGGYVDNLPVSSMRTMGANVIFAVDVGSLDDRTEMKYGE